MTAKPRQHKEDDKLVEVIIYLCDLSSQDQYWGAIKLNKLLFYADVLAYQRLGAPITGQEYMALPQGPAPRRLKPVTERMKKNGELRIERKRIGRFAQLRPIAGRPPNLSLFTKEQSNLLVDVVRRFWEFNATQISEESHSFLGWKLAKRGETIPYASALIGTRRPTEHEKRAGRALQKVAREALAGNDH